jgi:hypothetical protein
MTAAGGAHGVVAAAIFRAIDGLVERNALGMCFADRTGFQLPGLDDTVRSPDAAYVRADCLASRCRSRSSSSDWPCELLRLCFPLPSLR